MLPLNFHNTLNYPELSTAISGILKYYTSDTNNSLTTLLIYVRITNKLSTLIQCLLGWFERTRSNRISAFPKSSVSICSKAVGLDSNKSQRTSKSAAFNINFIIQRVGFTSHIISSELRRRQVTTIYLRSFVPKTWTDFFQDFFNNL